jgi:hypothetical protein
MPQAEERISGSLQENLLTTLCFDDAHCKIVRASVTPQLFESSVFREVAGHAIDFIDQYGEAIKDHLPDHLEGILKGEDERKAATYRRLLENLNASRDSVNAQYVVSQLHRFVRAQRFKAGLTKAIEAVEDGRIDEAEVEMQKAMKSQAVAFEKGTNLADKATLREVFDHPEEEGFELGIPELDRRGIIPRRGELFALIAPRKRGKSWFLTHCAKQANLQRWKVLVITLELSERAYAVRLIQSFFSVSRRAAQGTITRLKKGRDGDLMDVVREEIERASLSDANDREFGKRADLIVKGFPMHSTTQAEVEAYLESLERFENFVPDAILWDYPRLLRFDPKNLRIELGQAFAWIRGLGRARNCANVIVHQGNRQSETSTLVTADQAEEDISLVAVVDVALTFSQTVAEKRLGLARIYADYVRNAESKIQVLVTQAYEFGQFCLDSMRVGNEYWDLVKEARPGDRGNSQRHDDRDD